MKSVLMSLVIVLGFVGVASATDRHAVRERIVIVDKHVRAPIVERVIEYPHVQNFKVREFVVEDYGYNRDRVVERIEIRKPVVERQIVRERVVVKNQHAQRVVVKQQNSGFFGRLLGR